MKTRKMFWMRAIMIMCVLSMTVACENSEPLGNGEAEFEITDAPVDDANIKGVFVTVTDVRVNGNSIAGFSGKQTIDLKAYLEGKTKLLGSAGLSARTYNNLSLVLDLDNDANGNAPGCYVITTDNMKHKLATSVSGTLEVALTKSWMVRENLKSRIVLDVDLRKAIRYTGEEQVKYSFVSSGDLNSSVRLVDRGNSATISGTFEGDMNSNKQVVVYAYKKGTFNAEAETQADEGGISFKNAVSSSVVKAGVLNNTYTLAFMEEGEYNLIFATYTKDTSTGKFSLEAVLDTEASVNGSVSNIIQVKAGIDVSVSVSVK